MSVALKLYEQLTEASDDKTRARLIADAVQALEQRHLPSDQAASQGQLRETELRLLKEIEMVRKEIKEVEGRLKLEIEGVRKEIKEVEGQLLLEIKKVEVNLLQAINGQTRWILGGLAALGAIFKLADILIK